MATEFKLSYTASDINNRLGKIDILAEKAELPTKISDLTNDSGFATEVYVQEYAQQKGNYALKSEIPAVPNCSASNNGQFLRVVNGVATWSTIPNAEEGEF